MSSIDAPISTSSDCGCDAGLDALGCECCGEGGSFTPLEIYNRPGLSAIAYRVGTQPLFKRTMLDRLSPPLSATGAASPLNLLTSRSDADFSIALFDAWACVADVLTFYQERIANESYLRTATERRSVLELGRLVGYELRPGVAASTWLAFTMEQAPNVPVQGVPGLPMFANTPLPVSGTPGVPAATIIPIGTRVQSVPGPGEQPQTFETVEAVEARAEWNRIPERLTFPHPNDANLDQIVLRGLDSNLKPGDRLLLVDNATKTVNRVRAVKLDTTAQTTTVYLMSGTDPVFSTSPAAAPTLPTDSIPLTDVAIKSLLIDSDWDQNDLLALAAVQQWPLSDLQAMINRLAVIPTCLTAYVFLTKAAIFGHNAPLWDALPKELKETGAAYAGDWEGRTIADDSSEGSLGDASLRFVFLDNAYPALVPSKPATPESPAAPSWIVLEAPAAPRFDWPGVEFASLPALKSGGAKSFKRVNTIQTRNGFVSHSHLSWGQLVQQVFQIQDLTELSRAAYTLSAKVSRVQTDGSTDFENMPLRSTTAYAQSRPLNLGELPITTNADATRLTLTGAYLGLKPGQKVTLTGELANRRGVAASEVLVLDTVHLVRGFTRLTFKHGPVNAYVPATRWINANVAFATHGETRQEVVGGGDPSQAYQSFTLRQPPLTFTPAATPSGNQSTLQVWIDDLLWSESPMLYGTAPDQRIYITHQQDDGSTEIEFGDGITGARPPAGQGNIRAIYRRGIGAAGSVDANELSTLLTRPLGVKGVINPLPATGGEDPESGANARRNAALTIMTLDRIVSLSDYADFARAFTGVTKALATWTWDGARRGVLVTVAGPQGKIIGPTDALYGNLLDAMKSAGDKSVPLRLASYRAAPFRIAAAVLSDIDRDPAQVRNAIDATLRSAYGFDARSFGQSVTLSGLIAAIQNVKGVTEVNVTRLYRSADASATAPPPDQLVPDSPAAGAAVSGSSISGAELLLLDAAPLSDLIVTKVHGDSSTAGGTP